MNNRERVRAALRHEQPDRVPYAIGFTTPAWEKMVACYGPDFSAGIDNCFIGINAGAPQPWREVAPGIMEDPFGVQWNKKVDTDIGVVCNVCITEETLEDYCFPALDDPTNFQEAEQYLQNNPDQYHIGDIGFSLFERAWTLAGMETVLMGMVADPAFIHRLLDRILEFNLAAIDRACAQDIDAMMFGDDWGQQTGVMMGVPHWREFIKPRIAEMYAAAKRRGKAVFIHSCGKVDALFPDLIALGLDVFNPFQPEVMDVYDMKARYGDRLSFFGGISTQRTLPYGTPEETRDEVRRLLDIIGKDGGYIAAPAHSIPGDARPENIAAMLEVLQTQ